MPKLSAAPRGHAGNARVKVLQVAKFRGVPFGFYDSFETRLNGGMLTKKFYDYHLPNFKIMNFHGVDREKLSNENRKLAIDCWQSKDRNLEILKLVLF